MRASADTWQMTQKPPEPPTPLLELRFSRTRWREGYDVEQVDEFFRRAHRALELGDRSVTDQEARTVMFNPVRLREGYDMSEVDRELDRVAAALST